VKEREYTNQEDETDEDEFDGESKKQKTPKTKRED
jgi:hypothetical protein